MSMSNAECSRYLFLLGGYDLEMAEIRNMLDHHGCRFVDLQLSWGAKLSAYEQYFEPETMHVGIELLEDITTPENYMRIDHHNELSTRPASIEQVASLLGIELTRYQQMVAANDKAYIPGLIAMGASEKEIAEIRASDRAAQGVTQQDEELAEESIRHHLTVEKGITVVKSLTPKFSTITDRLFGRTGDKLLIYTDHECTYFGAASSKLVREMQQLLDEGHAYAGGNPLGFFGIKSGVYSVGELKVLVQKVISIVPDPFNEIQ